VTVREPTWRIFWKRSGLYLHGNDIKVHGTTTTATVLMATCHPLALSDIGVIALNFFSQAALTATLRTQPFSVARAGYIVARSSDSSVCAGSSALWNDNAVLDVDT
jgi:hypothetical protein